MNEKGFCKQNFGRYSFRYKDVRKRSNSSYRNTMLKLLYKMLVRVKGTQNGFNKQQSKFALTNAKRKRKI